MNRRSFGGIHERRTTFGSEAAPDRIERAVLDRGPIGDRGGRAGAGGRVARGRVARRRRGPRPNSGRGLHRHRAARVRPQQAGLAGAACFGRFQVSEPGAAGPDPPNLHGLGDSPCDGREQDNVQGSAGLGGRAPGDLHLRAIPRNLASRGCPVQPDSGGPVMATSTAQVGPSPAERPSAESIRTFLLVESATFLSAAALHFGVFVPGYAHGAASVAESVIAAVLLGGLLATWIRPRAARGTALD